MQTHFDNSESLSVAERQASQNRRLESMIRLAYEKSERVRNMFEERGLAAGDIRTCDELEALPVISREKLIDLEKEDPPYGGFFNADSDVDRIFTSPGPVYEPHLAETDPLWARAYYAAGIRKSDVVLNAFSYHMVAAGLTFHGGLRRVGATVIPSGTTGTQMQVQLMRDLKATAYTGTPSFLMAIIQKAEEMDFDFRNDLLLKRACFAAEPLAPSLRATFETQYGLDTYQMYGATEVGDIAYECSEKKGWHLCEEVFVEIVDPATGKRVPPGHLGEVVVTRFNPVFLLFRFGTGDLSRMIAEPCTCGRTSFRLDGIAGRIGDAIKVRGLFIAPSQMKQVADKFPGVKFQAVVRRSGHDDILVLRLQSGVAGDAASLAETFRSYFQEVCTVRINTFEFLQPGTLSEGDSSLVDERRWT